MVITKQMCIAVAQGVSFGGGTAIQRIRLLDELENGYTSSIYSKDIVEYYQLLAEKGKIEAQVCLYLNFCHQKDFQITAGKDIPFLFLL